MNVTFPRLARTILTSIGIAATLVLATGAAQAQQRGGTLRMVVFPEPPVLVSAANSSTFPGIVSTKIHEGLLKYDANQKPQPSLATSWTVAPDGKTVTFQLRRGVTWHDGKPFTSADVKFSMEKVWKTLHPRGRTVFGGVSEVQTPDDHTAVVKLDTPSPSMMGSLSGYESQVVPKHIYDGTDFNTNPRLSSPIGTGPFVFKEWRKGEFIRLERNPNYWDAGKPYLDAIIVRIIPDQGATATAFETNELDIGFFNPVPLGDVKRLSALPNLAVETKGYGYFGAQYLLELNLRNEYLKDVRVRRAMMHAIDRQFLVDNVWYGYGKVATGPVPSSASQFYSADVPAYPFDVAKANALLDEAGYKRGANGMRFKIVQNYPILSEVPRTAEYLKQALAKVGIDVEMRSLDLGSFIRSVYSNYDFEMTNNYIYMLTDPTVGVQRLYWSKNIIKGVPFANVVGYTNPDVDRLLVAAQTESNLQQRQAQFKEFQQIIQRELPILNLFELQLTTLYNKRVQNHTTGIDAPYASFAEVYLAK